MNYREHINEKVNKAYMVRSHLDYCSSLWAPYMTGDIEVLEMVQKELLSYF